MDELPKKCECGCDGVIEPRPHHRYRGTPRFLPGHHSRTEAMHAIRRAERVEMDPPNPSGLCLCGCGEKTSVAKSTDQKRGRLAGHPTRYVHGHHLRAGRKGERSPRWNGGRSMHRGYVLIYAPGHPDANAKNYVYEHRLVMERLLGRRLLRNEVVHHVNGAKDDNRPENLELWSRSHPSGQRVVDLLAWAQGILYLYGDADPHAYEAGR